MLNIPVILGSIRQGRQSIHAADFFVKKLKDESWQTQLVDFKVLPLPMLDCEKEPGQYKKVYPNENVQTWSGIADNADGFIIIVPEYNHSFPAVLKNALDWLYPEFNRKPVGLVGVSSGRIGAARAIEHLRPVLENFGMFGIRETVLFGPIKEAFDEKGNLLKNTYLKQADGLVKSLVLSAKAMRVARKSDAT